MNNTVFLHGFWEEFLYIFRDKFAFLVVNGISLPFFNNLIANENGENIS
ncbi:RAxF-45 family protein [Bacillus sp. 31A1R]|uniref:RAxF-45 family protein n=1 Tax=Robertmurraya mangrovi TaxID=3098077 RepID=A0ABU5J3K2_9BACI|nr:RAxF-45 family protein [Bacillus sp. 31A1R]MDZ5474013.1 RAxF-45 family protein [Bacillus sp. 31A1R]